MKKVLPVVMAVLSIVGCSNKAVEIKPLEKQQEVVDVPMIKQEQPAQVEISYNDFNNNIDNIIYFNFDSAEVNSTESLKVQNAVNILNTNGGNPSIFVAGHCDEFGSDEYNMALGLERALAVKKMLVAGSIGDDSIKIISYGELDPACMGYGEDCNSKNRRAQIEIK